MALPDKIFLIGMPGCGKTTLGQQLAAEINYPFIDLDDEIENSEERSIPQIFEEIGEGYFRRIEAERLRSVTKQHEMFVMACGGGTPCFHDNMKFINENGLSIYLKAEIPLLVKRMQASEIDKRPLVKESASNLETLLIDKLSKRSRFYNSAEITIKADSSTEELMDKIFTR
ncbi:MAG: shikimate kinase [Cyclobacteriaceae bacterium]